MRPVTAVTPPSGGHGRSAVGQLSTRGVRPGQGRGRPAGSAARGPVCVTSWWSRHRNVTEMAGLAGRRRAGAERGRSGGAAGRCIRVTLWWLRHRDVTEMAVLAGGRGRSGGSAGRCIRVTLWWLRHQDVTEMAGDGARGGRSGRLGGSGRPGLCDFLCGVVVAEAPQRDGDGGGWRAGAGRGRSGGSAGRCIRVTLWWPRHQDVTEMPRAGGATDVTEMPKARGPRAPGGPGGAGPARWP